MKCSMVKVNGVLSGILFITLSHSSVAATSVDALIAARDTTSVCSQFSSPSCQLSDDILAKTHYTISNNFHHNGNKETNYYLSSQVQKELDNRLILSVHSIPAGVSYNCADFGEPLRLCDYISGRIDTRGLWSTKGVEHGYVEVIATMPVAADGRDELYQGMWPAIWMLPVNSDADWPMRGEIDMVELRGLFSHHASTTLHYGNVADRTDYADHTFEFNPKYHDVPANDSYGYEHIYGLEWNFNDLDPCLTTWYDGEIVATRHLKINDASRGYPLWDDVFKLGQANGYYLILNIATGGTFGPTTSKTSNGSGGADLNNPLLQMKVRSIKSYSL